MNENEITLEKQKVNRMVNRIYDLERENTKTGKLNEKEMKTEIERLLKQYAAGMLDGENLIRQLDQRFQLLFLEQ